LITEMMVEIAHAGAGTWIMWFMVALSVLSLLLIGERFVFFGRHGGDAEVQQSVLAEQLEAGDLAAAQATVEGDATLIAAVARTGMNRLKDGLPAAREAMAATTGMQRLRFERGLAVLGTLGANAPFIGLLGTVVEIIHTLGNKTSLGPDALPEMMGDLATALAATAVGLFVALPAVSAHNYFQRRLRGIQAAADAVQHDIAAYALAQPRDEA
jgi:biopolymer transport protein ExbB